MPHPLVVQLRFARTEFQRGLEGITDIEARKQFAPMNCISWSIGHLAWQEQRYWLGICQHKDLPLPEIQEKFCSGCPPLTPALDEMWAAWKAIIETVDPYLDTLKTEDMLRPISVPNIPVPLTAGTLMLRVTYHYWYHTGENQAIRQLLGHTDLPQFVGDIDGEAPYQR